jgi:hypothetical protein
LVHGSLPSRYHWASWIDRPFERRFMEAIFRGAPDPPHLPYCGLSACPPPGRHRRTTDTGSGMHSGPPGPLRRSARAPAEDFIQDPPRRAFPEPSCAIKASTEKPPTTATRRIDHRID